MILVAALSPIVELLEDGSHNPRTPAVSIGRVTAGNWHRGRIRLRTLYDNVKIQITDLLNLNNGFLFPLETD